MKKKTVEVFCFFEDADPGGIALFARVPLLAHRAFERLVEKAPFKWSGWFQEVRGIIPLREMHVEYLKPIHSGQTCAVDILLLNLGTSSMTFRFHIRAKNHVMATVEWVQVYVDRRTKRPKKLPSALRNWLTKQFLR